MGAGYDDHGREPALPAESPALVLFFFNDTATTEIYTLSLHDALPILILIYGRRYWDQVLNWRAMQRWGTIDEHERSEEHTSELQSRPHLVCRLLLEKKKAEPVVGKGADSVLQHHYRHQQRQGEGEAEA